MKCLAGVFIGLLLIVFSGVIHAQNPPTTEVLVGEWEFMEATISVDGELSLTRGLTGSVKVDLDSFLGQWKDIAAPTTEQPKELSGTYSLDEARNIVVVFDGTNRIGLRYRLDQKNVENNQDDNWLNLEFSPEDSFSKEELGSMSSDDRKLLRELNRIKFSVLLKRK